MDYNYERPKFLPEDIANFFNCYILFSKEDTSFQLVPDRKSYTAGIHYGETLYYNAVKLDTFRFIYNSYAYSKSNSSAYLRTNSYFWVSPTYRENTVPTFHIGDEVYFCYSHELSGLTKGRIVDIASNEKENPKYGDDKQYLVETTENTWCSTKGEREWVCYYEITKDPQTLPEIPSTDCGALTPIKRTPQEIADFFGLCVYASSENNNTMSHFAWKDIFTDYPYRDKDNGWSEIKNGMNYCYMMYNPYYFNEQNTKTNFPRLNHDDRGVQFWVHEKMRTTEWHFNSEYNYTFRPCYVDFTEVLDKKNGMLYLPKYLRQDDTYKKSMKNRLEFVKNYEE